ncbi:MAG: phage protein Gp36 family protein [Planctomycetota bacterium]
MGTYITRSDIEVEFGVNNVAIWSNLDNDDAQVNDDRVDASIAYAEQQVDDLFRDGRYAIPLRGTAGDLNQVKRWAAVLAGHWLVNRRAVYMKLDQNELTGIEQMREDVFDDIARYTSGQAKLAAELVNSQPDTPQVVG